MQRIIRVDDAFPAFAARVAEQFLPAGRFARHYARGKLLHDPLFRYLLSLDVWSRSGRLLDLGCGQGILLACLAALDGARDGKAIALHGIELRARRVRAARQALGSCAFIEQGDIRTATFPTASIVVIADVLLYMAEADQERVIERSLEALEPGGILILREADRSAGLCFHVTHWSERIAQAARGAPFSRLCYRPASGWADLLRSHRLDVETLPMSQGTPFGNALQVARRPL